MTQVDFYVLETPSQGDRFQLCCRLVEKAWDNGHRILVHCASTDEAQRMDHLLWVFRDQSFVAHGRLGEVDATVTPVLIAHGDGGGDEHDVLVNLAPEVPAFFSRFERVAEPVDTDPAARAASRERFKFYRDRGYQPTVHRLD
jgi:DNA polymerase-3 subunit chi